MTWKNKGGWDGGNRGPWGQEPTGGGAPKPRRPAGGGQTPPDLEEWLRRHQEKLRGMFPNGRFGGRGAVLLAIAAFVLWLASGIYRVEPDEQGVVMRFGEFKEMTDPGLRYHWPVPIETVLKPKVTRVNKVEIGFVSSGTRESAQRALPQESQMLTGDENIVDINFEVQWKIKDAKAYLFNIREPQVTVKNAAESDMREIFGMTPIATALAEGRSNVEQQARNLLQQMLDSYGAGIDVVRLQMLKVDPPSAVIDAFRDVQTARADAERSINQAETYSNDILPRARGEAEQQLQDAQAYRQRVVAVAEGESQRFIAVHNEFRSAPQVTRERMYLETMESLLKGMPKVIIDDSVKGAVPFLPIHELGAKKAKE